LIPWRRIGLVLGAIGLADSLYLVVNSFDESVPLACPTTGVINCGTVTSSAYGKILGIPVAVLGFLWFVIMITLIFVNRPSYSILLVPLWVAGIAFTGYLIFVELSVLHAICLYCTLAHVTAIVLGAPAIKLALEPG
jgi:uncharacterized membrane protein